MKSKNVVGNRSKILCIECTICAKQLYVDLALSMKYLENASETPYLIIPHASDHATILLIDSNGNIRRNSSGIFGHNNGHIEEMHEQKNIPSAPPVVNKSNNLAAFFLSWNTSK